MVVACVHNASDAIVKRQTAIQCYAWTSNLVNNWYGHMVIWAMLMLLNLSSFAICCLVLETRASVFVGFSIRLFCGTYQPWCQCKLTGLPDRLTGECLWWYTAVYYPRIGGKKRWMMWWGSQPVWWITVMGWAMIPAARPRLTAHWVSDSCRCPRIVDDQLDIIETECRTDYEILKRSRAGLRKRQWSRLSNLALISREGKMNELLPLTDCIQP